MAVGTWFLTRGPASAASRLFCLAHAGGGASAFLGWARWLPPQVELRAVQLPGREHRYEERALRRMSAVVDRLAEEMRPFLDRSYVLFGASMGACLAYELTQRLADSNDRTPDHLFVAACRPPHAPALEIAAPELDDASLLAVLQERFGGVPDELARDSSLASVFLPALRADLEVLSTYEPSSGPPLACPLTPLGGRGDAAVPPPMLKEWARYSEAPSAPVLFHGGHFFWKDRAGLVVDRIVAPLAAPVVRS